jgi:ketosteroid isomerase-like protein
MDTTSAHLAVTAEDVAAWTARYIRAWETNDAHDIASLFTEDAEYHESPYETDWIGRDEIVEGWRSRWGWQQGGWTFDWNLVSLDGPVAVVQGVGRYTELGNFDNVWTLTFRTPELCDSFQMVNTERHTAGG